MNIYKTINIELLINNFFMKFNNQIMIILLFD